MTGAMLQTDMGPSWLYWPRAVSIRYIGFPTSSRMMMYGNRKAPGGETKTFQHREICESRVAKAETLGL